MIDLVHENAKFQETPAFQKQVYLNDLRNSKQGMALTSLVYNNVTPPKTIDAMLRNDPVAAREELLYRSNGGSSRGLGIARRRKDEANMLTGDPSTWPKDLQERWNQVEAKPEHVAYRQEFSKIFPQETNAEIATRSSDADIKGSEGMDLLQNTDPDVTTREIMESMQSPSDDPIKDISLKKPHQMTADERRTAQASQTYRKFSADQQDSFAQNLTKVVTKSYEHQYGDGPIQFDTTRKMISPQPIRNIPTKPMALTTGNGAPMDKASAEIANNFGHLAQTQGAPKTVKGLQSGLNALNLAKGTQTPPLLEDGIYGPKTDYAVKSTLSQSTLNDVSNALSWGNLKNAADAAKPVKPSGQKGLLDIAKMPQPADLQKGLNDIGRQTGGFASGPLKVDGIIGPKTTAAAGEAMNKLASLNKNSTSSGGGFLSGLFNW